MKLLLRLLSALALAVALDWLTKAWAEQSLVLYEPVPVVGQVFRLTLGYNTGVAFGLFANGGVWPLIATGLVILGLAVWFTRALYVDQLPPIAAWPVGLLLGGALANFVDRLADGHVTDFLDIGWAGTRWPTFNLADTFIILGLALLLLITSFGNHEPVKDKGDPLGSSVSQESPGEA